MSSRVIYSHRRAGLSQCFLAGPTLSGDARLMTTPMSERGSYPRAAAADFDYDVTR